MGGRQDLNNGQRGWSAASVLADGITGRLCGSCRRSDLSQISEGVFSHLFHSATSAFHPSKIAPVSFDVADAY
jgi:hypothetical protein